jgi:predicted DNA-binding protein with PD1-like motif
MTITLRQVNPQGTQVYMGTLTGGLELHPALADLMTQLQGGSATFELLGGLTLAEFAAYDFQTHQRHALIPVQGALEIIAGHGTITWLDDAPHVHTHLLVSQRDRGNNVSFMGGHCARAVVFAVEFTLTVYHGERVIRAEHAASGLKLWDLPPVDKSIE